MKTKILRLDVIQILFTKWPKRIFVYDLEYINWIMNWIYSMTYYYLIFKINSIK